MCVNIELVVFIFHNKADVLQFYMYSGYYSEQVDVLVLLVLCDINFFIFCHKGFMSQYKYIY